MVVEDTFDKPLADMPAIQSGLLIRTIHTDRQTVFPGFEHVRYVKGKGIKVSGMVTEKFPIQEHIGKIIHPVEVQACEFVLLICN